MKKTIVCFCFLLLSFATIANEDKVVVPNHLVLQLQEAQGDYQRVLALEAIANCFIKNNEFEEAKPYVGEIARLSEKSDNNYIKTLHCFYSIYYLMEDNDYMAAIPFLCEVEPLLETLDDNDECNALRVHVYSLMAKYYYYHEMLPETYDYLHRSFHFSEELVTKDIYFGLRQNLMMLYLSMERYRDCIAVGKEISGHIQKNKIVYYYLHMFDAYNLSGEIDTALIYADSAQMSDTEGKMERIIDERRTKLYLDNGDFDEAYRCFEKMQQNENYDGLNKNDSLYLAYRSQLYKAIFFSRQKQFDSALLYIDRSLETSAFVSLNDECDAMLWKTEILRSSGRYEEALDNVITTQTLIDSLNRIKNVRKVESIMFQEQKRAYEAEQQHENYVRDSRYRVRVLTAIIIALLFLACCVILVLVMKRRKMQHRLVEEELEERNREIASAVVVMKKKNEVYTEVISQLQELKAQTENRGMKKTLTQVSNKIEQTMDDDFYDEFDLRFRRVHPDFIEKLTKRHPDLTPNEIKICSFLKLNMSTKDIAQLTGQSVAAIEMTRYRIRRKLGISLDDHAHLSQYIMKI